VASTGKENDSNNGRRARKTRSSQYYQVEDRQIQAEKGFYSWRYGHQLVQ
jgi:hypothetical protein